MKFRVLSVLGGILGLGICFSLMACSGGGSSASGGGEEITQIVTSVVPDVVDIPSDQPLQLTLFKESVGVSEDVVWSVENPSILSVNDFGVVEGLSPGTTTVSATLDGVSYESVITISEAVATSSLHVFPVSASIWAGQKFSFSSQNLGNNIKTCVYLEDSSVAQFDGSGNLTGYDEGDVQVLFVGDAGFATASVTVRSSAPGSAPSVPEFGLTAPDFSVESGSVPSPAVVLNVSENLYARWFSDNRTVVDFNFSEGENEFIWGSDGTANVYGVLSGNSSSLNCFVIEGQVVITPLSSSPPIVEVDSTEIVGLSDGDELLLGGSSYSVSVVPDSDSLQWESSDETILVVDSVGDISLFSTGEVVISVEDSFNNTTGSISVDVVRLQEVHSIDEWFSDAPYQFGLVDYDGALWVIGGRIGNAYGNKVYRSTSGGDSVCTFNVNVGCDWEEMDSAPWAGRRGHTVTVFNGKIWVIGGRSSSTIFNDVFSFDGSTWVTENVFVSGPGTWLSRYDHTNVVYNDELYVIAGRGDSGTGGLSDVWKSADGVTWERIADNAGFGSVYGHVSVVFNNDLFVIGGQSENFFGNGISVYSSSVYSSPDGVAWTSVGALPSARSQATGFVFADDGSDERLWIVGGEGPFGENSGYHFDMYHSYDGSTWTAVPTEFLGSTWTSRADVGVVVTDNAAIFIGGDADGGYRDVLLMLDYDTISFPF